MARNKTRKDDRHNGLKNPQRKLTHWSSQKNLVKHYRFPKPIKEAIKKKLKKAENEGKNKSTRKHD